MPSLSSLDVGIWNYLLATCRHLRVFTIHFPEPFWVLIYHLLTGSGQHSHVHGLSAGSRPSHNDQLMTETQSNEDRQWE